MSTKSASEYISKVGDNNLVLIFNNEISLQEDVPTIKFIIEHVFNDRIYEISTSGNEVYIKIERVLCYIVAEAHIKYAFNIFTSLDMLVYNRMLYTKCPVDDTVELNSIDKDGNVLNWGEIPKLENIVLQCWSIVPYDVINYLQLNIVNTNINMDVQTTDITLDVGTDLCELVKFLISKMCIGNYNTNFDIIVTITGYKSVTVF